MKQVDEGCAVEDAKRFNKQTNKRMDSSVLISPERRTRTKKKNHLRNLSSSSPSSPHYVVVPETNIINEEEAEVDINLNRVVGAILERRVQKTPPITPRTLSEDSIDHSPSTHLIAKSFSIPLFLPDTSSTTPSSSTTPASAPISARGDKPEEDIDDHNEYGEYITSPTRPRRSSSLPPPQGAQLSMSTSSPALSTRLVPNKDWIPQPPHDGKIDAIEKSQKAEAQSPSEDQVFFHKMFGLRDEQLVTCTLIVSPSLLFYFNLI